MNSSQGENTPIRLIPLGSTPQIIESSIAAFNEPLAEFLNFVGLPTEHILSPIEERRKIIYSLESTIEILPLDERAKAVYLSKFTVSVSIGLFDGALNFLWNEVIQALRRLITNFDLQYFFSIAETVNSKYKRLADSEDLEALTDHDLLEISRRIGLISDLNFKRLENVNYLRNHASAAHPNNNSVSGIEMLSLLETSLKYAITAKPDHSIIKIKQLSENIRTKLIPDEDFIHIGEELNKQPQERVDDFMISLLGLYTDSRQTPETRKNIENLVPKIWVKVSEDIRYLIGSKFGYYRSNGDTNRKDAIQKLLEIVDGLKYKDELSITSELLEKLQNLKTVHFSWNNFYNEYEYAKSIDATLPSKGIPSAIRTFFVKVICLCHIGNGNGYKEGIDERANVFYKKFIDSFGINEIKTFLTLFTDPEFTTDFAYRTPDRRLRVLVEHLKTKTKDEHINRALDVIIKFPKNSLDNVASDSRFKEAAKFIK